MARTPRPAQAPRAVLARVVRGRAAGSSARFASTFTIGRGSGCDLRLPDEGVAAVHVQVVFDGVLWWARDRSGGAGTFARGARIQLVPLREATELDLGEGGPRVELALAPEGRPAEEADRAPPREAGAKPLTETQVIQRYLGADAGAPSGRETLVIRRALARVQRRSARRYQLAVGAALLLLLGAGGVIFHQQRKLAALRATAERVFYAMKAVEVQTAAMEEQVARTGDARAAAQLAERRKKVGELEGEYDAFVAELDVYGKLPPDERVILRVARTFGECEVNVPKGFVSEVRRYVDRWRSTDRLARSLQALQSRGYAPVIARAFAERHLPPQYLFLALQESGFDERAVGPPTRYGYAKGMWQFIAPTASQYGLRVGPLQAEPVYDPRDERFDWRKATVAAARYVKDLHAGEAQGSGFLVMASYNWGQDNVRGVLARLPATPQDRNFWRLLADRAVPRETYDYTLAIFSAAVICEDPRLFGFELTCPSRP